LSRIERYEEMQVWQLARKMVSTVYLLTQTPEFAKDFGLKDQIRRSAVSIPSNIAEGFERDGNNEFVQFLYIAKGSAGELRTQLILALDLKYIHQEQFDTVKQEIEEISRMLKGFIIYLKNSGYKGTKYNSSKVSEADNMIYQPKWQDD
jgi:four helix bundle protein